jgi:L-rhamnose-H+ transport protein
MEPQQILGFGLILVGAICGGSFGLPSKYAKEDTPWEVLWGPFFFFVTILIPCAIAPLVVNDLGNIYASVGLTTIISVLVFGFLWGLGSMTLGMSFAFIGLSLAYALNYGAQIACGFTLPMLIFDANQFLTPYGCVIVGGVIVCLIGVVVCGRAGMLKERSIQNDTPAAEKAATSAGKNPGMLFGLMLAFGSGILCACYAVAYRCGEDIGAVAEAKDGANNPAWAAAWAITALILWGGAVSSCLYCIIQLTKNKTWGHLAKPGIGLTLLLAAVMAILHDAAIFFWGVGVLRLGGLGVSVGYPVFMSLAIIVGNVHGFRTGEWKGASRQSILWIVVGIAILIAGVCLIAQGKAMMPAPTPEIEQPADDAEEIAGVRQACLVGKHG